MITFLDLIGDKSMGRSKMMGAGSACSTLYDCNVNLKTCGGNKKQGLAVKVDGSMDFNHRFIQTKAFGKRRDVVFTMNQLGGVSSSSFGSSAHSYARGDSVSYKKPYLCYPYCNLSIKKIAKPLIIPNTVEAVLTVPQWDVFQYSNYDGFTHCYTDASRFNQHVEDFEVNNQSLTSYLQSFFPQTNISTSQITTQFKEALWEEDKNTWNSLLSIDRVDGSLYSTPNVTGFKYGKSVCSQLYESMLNHYPERVVACPTRQNILQSGDEFTFSGQFNYEDTYILINFNIKIE